MSVILLTILAAGLIGPIDRTTVSTEWLARNLDNPDVVVVEIGVPSATADHPHIPTARFIPVDSLVVSDAWPRNELPSIEQLRRVLGNAGVGDDGRIIIYSRDPIAATRAWFTLDYLGQGDRTAILDGGFNRWSEEKRPIALKRFAHAPKTFTPFPDSSRVIAFGDVRNSYFTSSVFIDARPAGEFDGLRAGADVSRRGHIPGAFCVPWRSNLTPAGTFRSSSELQAMYANIIDDPDARIVVYCRTGMDASMTYFVLRSLGYDVALYDGSFTEWSRDRRTAVATLSRGR